tara:strand:- start:5621 stop:6205 length:585 start_codon:yes stop_codon:yes gene_type:complete
MKNLIKKILKEENDFGWAEDIEPASKADIANDLSDLQDWGYYIHNPEKHPDKLVDFIYNLGLDVNKLDGMVGVLYNFGEAVYDSGRERGSQDGWEEGESEGYREGYREAERELEGNCEDEIYEARDVGYEEGYDAGHEKGYEDCEEKEVENKLEKIYNKGFEEGRAYQSDLDTEEYEKRQSGFDPRDYDEDYEN